MTYCKKLCVKFKISIESILLDNFNMYSPGCAEHGTVLSAIHSDGARLLPRGETVLAAQRQRTVKLLAGEYTVLSICGKFL